jgi:cytochrome c1
VGWKRSASFLKESILEPTAEIGNSSETFVDGTRRYWPVTLTLADGTSVQGVVLNEDSYSIQVIDEEERLLSYTKKLLKEVRRGQVSSMPTFQDDLTDAEVDDLVAYLASLKRK